MNWIDVENICNSLINKIEDIDCVVGIAKGGMIPATIVATLLKQDQLYSIGYRSYSDKKKGRLKQTVTVHQDLKNKKILLVDDISATGHTLKRAKKDLEKLGNKVKTLTLNRSLYTDHIPDYCGTIETKWVEYPWENN